MAPVQSLAVFVGAVKVEVAPTLPILILFGKLGDVANVFSVVVEQAAQTFTLKVPDVVAKVEPVCFAEIEQVQSPISAARVGATVSATEIAVEGDGIGVVPKDFGAEGVQLGVEQHLSS